MSEIQEFDANPPTAITIPPGCEGCAVQCTLSNQLGVLMLQKQSLEATGMNMMGDDDDEGSFDSIIKQQVPEEYVEEAKIQFRQQVSQQIDHIASRLDATQNEIDQNALACRGVRKVQFTEGEIEYTVSVCTSDRVNTGRDTGFPRHVSTHIQTNSVIKPEQS